ncbi:hypothetical protein LCGC14_2868040 [marine sediment metagenome]|uniref:Uncharacterized protein n=1 Tax=marine sediment metagenome TaxID=412755 RepID=A0A0F8Y3L1_9ZZZZ
MTNATQTTTTGKGEMIRECGRHGDYLDASSTRCPDCSRVGTLVGKLCQCTDVTLNGTERVAWTCAKCFGTVVRPARIGN